MSVTNLEQSSSLPEAVTEPRTSAVLAVKRYKSATVFWCGLAFCCLPFLVPYFRTLWRQELYQYFPFVFVGVGYLFLQRWDHKLRLPETRTAKIAIVLGVSVLVAASALHSTWLGNCGFVLLGAAFFFSQRELKGNTLAMLALPLLTLIRWPQLHAQSVVVRLQNVTSQLAALILDLLSVPNLTHGNTIRLPTRDLFVAEACSGIQSAFTLCFLALLIVVWKRRSVMLAPIYLVAALAFAILANVFRVTTVALAEAWYQADWASGWSHTILGYVSLAIGAGTLLSFDMLVEMLVNPLPTSHSEKGVNPLVAGWNWAMGFQQSRYQDSMYGWEENEDENLSVEASSMSPSGESGGRNWLTTSLLAMSSFAAVVMLFGFVSGRSDSRPIVSKTALLFEPPQNLLDGANRDLVAKATKQLRDGEQPLFGNHADVWTCNAFGKPGELMISQPYVGWHELCVCYEVQGWTLAERYNAYVESDVPVAVGEFTNDAGGFGYLVFSAIDSDGSIPTPPSYTLFGRVVAPFFPLITDDFAETSGSAQTAMLQLFTTSSEPLSADEIGELAKALADVRKSAQAEMLSQQSTIEPKVDSTAGSVGSLFGIDQDQ